nr:MAG TPA_asm: hypothetical protein [Caudoviricetes sp.]
MSPKQFYNIYIYIIYNNIIYNTQRTVWGTKEEMMMI